MLWSQCQWEVLYGWQTLSPCRTLEWEFEVIRAGENWHCRTHKGFTGFSKSRIKQGHNQRDSHISMIGLVMTALTRMASQNIGTGNVLECFATQSLLKMNVSRSTGLHSVFSTRDETWKWTKQLSGIELKKIALEPYHCISSEALKMMNCQCLSLLQALFLLLCLLYRDMNLNIPNLWPH